MYDELRTNRTGVGRPHLCCRTIRPKAAIREVVELIDKGFCARPNPSTSRVASGRSTGWVKKAVILYFPIQKMRTMRAGELEWYDKMDIKHDYDRLGVRAVPMQ